MTEWLTGSNLFALLLTLAAYELGRSCQQRWKSPLLNPILIGASSGPNHPSSAGRRVSVYLFCSSLFLSLTRRNSFSSSPVSSGLSLSNTIGILLALSSISISFRVIVPRFSRVVLIIIILIFLCSGSPSGRNNSNRIRENSQDIEPQIGGKCRLNRNIPNFSCSMKRLEVPSVL